MSSLATRSFVSTLTFCASANPIVYEGGVPIFIDADPATWNMDPQLLHDELRTLRGDGEAAEGSDLRRSVRPERRTTIPSWKLVLATRSPSLKTRLKLGATYRGKMAGAFGKCAAFSFNGNKIITTSGGGMLVSMTQVLH